MAGFDLLDAAQAPKGLVAHFKTPLQDDGRLDEASYLREARYLVDVGACLAVTGMIGCETLALSDAERVRSLELALDVCDGRVPVCASAVGASVADVVSAAVRAEAMGADMIAVTAPAWIRTEADMVTCILAAARAVARPVMVHSIGGVNMRPGSADVVLSVETLAELPARASNIRYLKEEAARAPRRVAALLAQPGGDAYFAIKVGQPLVLGYLAGARQFMASANVAEVYLAVLRALEAAGSTKHAGSRPCWRRSPAFQRYVGGEFSNKVIMYRQGLFRSSPGRVALPCMATSTTSRMRRRRSSRPRCGPCFPTTRSTHRGLPHSPRIQLRSRRFRGGLLFLLKNISR